jgi:hypothetical protein
MGYNLHAGLLRSAVEAMRPRHAPYASAFIIVPLSSLTPLQHLPRGEECRGLGHPYPYRYPALPTLLLKIPWP